MDDVLAEDLTATTFEKAWKARSAYRQDLGAVSTWLFTIARHVATDYFRQHRPESELDEVYVDGNHARPVEERVQREDELMRLTVLVKDLSTRERELVALKYGAEMTNRNIAELTGLSESNVGTILYRVIVRLRADWEVKQK
jgi:RNA polymerase sigma-70 factor (ECF subfamily)